MKYDYYNWKLSLNSDKPQINFHICKNVKCCSTLIYAKHVRMNCPFYVLIAFNRFYVVQNRGSVNEPKQKDQRFEGKIKCDPFSLFFYSTRDTSHSKISLLIFSWVNRHHVRQHCFVYAYYIPTNLPF